MLIRSIWTRPSRSLIGPPSSPRSRLARISATLSLLIGRHLYQTVYVGRVRSSVLRLIGSRISWRSRAQWCEGAFAPYGLVRLPRLGLLDVVRMLAAVMVGARERVVVLGGRISARGRRRADDVTLLISVLARATWLRIPYSIAVRHGS